MEGSRADLYLHKFERQLTPSSILQHFARSPENGKLRDSLVQNAKNIRVKGLTGSSWSLVTASLFKTSDRPFLVIFNDKEEAAYFLNDLENLLGDKNVLFYPGSYRRPYQIEETDNANVLLRAEVLNRINSRQKPALIVTYPDALFEKVVTRKELDKKTLRISIGDALSLDFLNEVLFEYQFKRVDFVSEPGEFSVRGGIVDVFSFSHDEPYRIEFFGNDVESIRTFDVETQLSTGSTKKISVIPNVEDKTLHEERNSFLKYIASKTAIFIKDQSVLEKRLDLLYEKANNAFKSLNSDVKRAEPYEIFLNTLELKEQLKEFCTIYFGSFDRESLDDETSLIRFKTKPQPSFNKSFELLISDLMRNQEAGYQNYIFCSTQQQAQRFHDIFDEVEQEIHYQTIILPLHQGFIEESLKLVCYTDHQIFERYHRFHLKNGYAKKQAITLKELNKLEIGDYVTHIDHGIGKFGGLQKIDVEGKKQEAIKLMYGDRDILYVSIHALHKISKFNGKDWRGSQNIQAGFPGLEKTKTKDKIAGQKDRLRSYPGICQKTDAKRFPIPAR